MLRALVIFTTVLQAFALLPCFGDGNDVGKNPQFGNFGALAQISPRLLLSAQQ